MGFIVKLKGTIFTIVPMVQRLQGVLMAPASSTQVNVFSHLDWPVQDDSTPAHATWDHTITCPLKSTLFHS